MTKILWAAGGAALLCGGSMMACLKAQTPMPPQDALTLQNIEALATVYPDLEVALKEACAELCTGSTDVCELLIEMGGKPAGIQYCGGRYPR